MLVRKRFKHMFTIKPMLVSEAMIKEVKTIRPDSNLQEAAAEMNKHRIGSLVAVSGPGEVVGILTERDMIKAMEKNSHPSEVKVEEAMTKKDKLILIEHGATIDEAAEAMLKYKIKKLPVVDEAENLVGIITATDLIKYRNELVEKFAGLIGLKRKQQAGMAG